MNKNKFCVVFMCNNSHFNKFIYSCDQLIENGKYKGDICLVIGDDLKENSINTNDYIIKHNIIVKYFPTIIFPESFLEINKNIESDGRNLTKTFQWHKLHLFNVYFKKYEYVFYMDCAINIFQDITPILNEVKENTLLAHDDSYLYPMYKLFCQFDSKTPAFKKLNGTYNLNINFFQTTILLYDTKLIEEDTYDKLYNLAVEYPISKTNEQGIMALYFTCIKPCWTQLRIKNENTHFYDFYSRNRNNKYIMLKARLDDTFPGYYD